MYILFIFKYILLKCDTLCLLYLTSKEQMIFNFLIEIFFLFSIHYESQAKKVII